MRAPTYATVLALTLTAAAATACLTAPGLAAWTDALPDCAATRLAGTAAHGLADVTERVGLGRPAAALHAAVRNLEARRFGAQPDQ